MASSHRRHRAAATGSRRGGWSGLLLLSALVLAGCGGGRPQTATLVHDQGLAAVRDAGMAVAPMVVADPTLDARDAERRMTEELHAELFAAGGEGTLVSPEDVDGLLAAGGQANVDHFRAVQRGLVRGQTPSADDLLRLSRIVQHRYLLMTWFDESTSTGIETGAGNAAEIDLVERLHNTDFAQLIGRVEGVLLDLWEGRILWRGRQDYRTERLYGDSAQVDAEIERARVDAAARFADQLGSS